MCEFYIYKIVDNAVIALLFAMTVFYWRGAMGVGAFLNAKVIDKDRRALIKFKQYIALRTRKDESISAKEFTKNNIVESRYNKSTRIHYIFAIVNIIFLILLLALSYIEEEGIVGSIITIHIFWTFLITIIFFGLILILLFKFSHIKLRVIGVSDESHQHIKELLSDATKRYSQEGGE